jgi:hypothetical protein
MQVVALGNVDFAEKVKSQWGRVDVLVNAGISCIQPAENTSASQFRCVRPCKTRNLVGPPGTVTSRRHWICNGALKRAVSGINDDCANVRE